MSAAESNVNRSTRELWVDALRGLAVMGMVWTHACNTFLKTELQGTVFFAELTYWHGLVAPTFFYLAGYNRGQSAARSGPRKPIWPTVQRLLLVWLLGYVMHAPWLALLRWSWDEQALRSFFVVDVLHCLAVSCLVLLGLERLGRRLAAVAAALLIVAVLKLSFLGYTTGWLVVDAYLTREHGSIFPLLPWVGFAAWGFLVALLPVALWRRLCMGLLLAVGLPWLSSHWAAGYIPQVFFLERVGWVMVFAAGTAWLWPRLGQGAAQGAAVWWVSLMGRRSLLVYVAHLMMIHALPLWAGYSLECGIGATQAWPMVWLIFVLLLAASAGLAWAWEQRVLRKVKLH
jgi:uncharacterized membrane protein